MLMRLLTTQSTGVRPLMATTYEVWQEISRALLLPLLFDIIFSAHLFWVISSFG